MNDIVRHGVKLECRQGDIAHQPDIEVVVNAANAELGPGGGVAGAIHRAAGPDLARECATLAPIEPGQAVITGAHRLPNRYVIHCLGPVYGRDEPARELLAGCYRNALRLVERNELVSIAFPALSTGAFGYPMEAAARVAFTTILAEMQRLDAVKLIRMVLYSEQDRDLHVRVLRSLAES